MSRINDYAERTTLTGNEELVGVEGASTFKLTPETLRQYDESYGLTGNIIRSIDGGGGGDFTTLTAFFDWLDANTFDGADIVLNVSPGTYTLTDVTRTVTAAQGINSLKIAGTAKATCIISRTGAAGVTFKGTSIEMEQLTFNTVSPAGGSGALIVAYDGCKVNHCIFNNFRVAIDLYGYEYNTITNCDFLDVTLNDSEYYINLFWAYAGISNCTFTTSGPWTWAISVYDGSVVSVYNTSISDSDYAIYVTNQSRVKVGSMTLSGNTADYNIPLREIQYDGSYITDGAGPMSFKT
jgi:hypothetical protein